MIPVKGALYFLGAVVAGFLLWWGYGVYQRSLDAERAEHKRIVQLKSDSIAVALSEKARLDSALANQVPIYLQARSAALTNPARPASAEVRACYAEADKVISACQKARAADSVVIAQQTSLITTLRNPPPPKAARRLQAFGEGMYDLAHSVPVIRLGATARLLGPVSLSVAGEYAAPRAGNADPQFRALAGVRINF